MDANAGQQAAEDEFSVIIRNFNLWQKIANFVGIGPYDEPDWADGRLYFRSDYSAKVKEWPDWAASGYWGAWIITPTAEGYFCVLRSLLHEREAERSETVEAMFSRPADAGKYIILQVGDSARYKAGLETLFIKWDDGQGDSRIHAESAPQEAVNCLRRLSPTLETGFAEKHLKRYTAENNPSSYGFALPPEEVNMRVLAMSFEELTAALLDGMPDSITSQAAGWRQ